VGSMEKVDGNISSEDKEGLSDVEAEI
jgi:hypothetical protein